VLEISHEAFAELAKTHVEANFSWLAREVARRVQIGQIIVDPSLRERLAMHARLEELVAESERLRIDAVRDVLAYCCLALHQPYAAYASDIGVVVAEYLNAIEIPADQRFDAIHALLPRDVVNAIFGDSDETWPGR